MPIKNIQLFIFVSTIVFSSYSLGETAPKNQHKLVHHADKITVDGQLNEPVWEKATKMLLAYENNPGDGIPASVKTEIFFYENGESFNVAIKAYDPEPEKNSCITAR